MDYSSNKCNLDCIKYPSEPFEDKKVKPYCRWCGKDFETDKKTK